jgi:hypothetical protein
MSFSYTSAGSTIVRGCADYILSQNYHVKYANGAIVYNRNKARQKGKLEKLAIRSHRIVPGNVLYKDSFNGLWNEDELCSQQEAIDLALLHYEEQIELEQAAPCG